MDKAEAIRRVIAKQEETRFSGISEGQIKILCDIATVMDLQGVYKKHNHSIAYVAGYTNVKAVKQALAGLENRGLIIRLYNQLTQERMKERRRISAIRTGGNFFHSLTALSGI